MRRFESDGFEQFDSGAGSLREALAGACAGGTIRFSADFNTPQTIMLTGEILIDKDITINGAGADLLTINANNAGRVFRITGGNVNLSGLTITGGNGAGDGNGGGIANTGGNLTLTNSVVTGNAAPNLGGGIYSTSALTINGSTISGNAANNATGATGGGIYSAGSLLIVNSTVSGNSVPNGADSGGGIRVENTTAIVNSTITNNSAAGTGSAGGVFRGAGTVTIRNSIIAANQNNTTPDAAGAFDPASAFNLIDNVGTATGFSAANQNQTGNAAAPLDPMLGTLGDNGGTTPTHALLAGSVRRSTQAARRAFRLPNSFCRRSRPTGAARCVRSIALRFRTPRAATAPTSAHSKPSRRPPRM